MSASLCCFLSVGLLVFVSADQKTIRAESGQKNITLPCRAPNNNNIITAEWHRADLEPKYVLLFRDGHIDPDNQHSSFKNRVDLQDKQMKGGDVSLILKDVTTADSGTYECHVFMSGTNNELISTIFLSVVDPPGQRGRCVGLKVDMPVLGLVLVVAAGFAM